MPHRYYIPPFQGFVDLWCFAFARGDATSLMYSALSGLGGFVFIPLRWAMPHRYYIPPFQGLVDLWCFAFARGDATSLMYSALSGLG
jgi:hypothetical protein